MNKQQNGIITAYQQALHLLPFCGIYLYKFNGGQKKIYDETN